MKLLSSQSEQRGRKRKIEHSKELAVAGYVHAVHRGDDSPRVVRGLFNQMHDRFGSFPQRKDFDPDSRMFGLRERIFQDRVLSLAVAIIGRPALAPNRRKSLSNCRSNARSAITTTRWISTKSLMFCSLWLR